MTANTFGTTLNNFFMGVEAANNLVEGTTGYALKGGNGFTNWGMAGTPNSAGLGDQQVVTEITNTPKISEKPFLYLDDDGEYKVFVPAVRENARGISWGEGKANGGMGEGRSLSLDAFYIAKPTDTAAKINQQIASGKNIYFTPGTYHAETPIVVDRANTILLGTGMASIIPDNGEAAMLVGDKDGIRIEGLIFDAGLSSKILLRVGTKGTHTNHSGNPIILQDLFFRVGGTTDVLTKADDALEINSDDVIGDHFWIWRADHGAGVEWYGNESKHGLIVNGDRVKCYALFNEHFQEYHTLWNGEDGATYFYQNETCYDPISQEAWMSHNGTVKGYSSYKVSNDVKNHYAAGLGIYNVFIYTGRTYDATGIGIQLDNAIEVPNQPGVLVENACTQTFANDEKPGGGFYPLSKINHIINGIGGSVSSGISSDYLRGEGWSRKFVLYYHNGEAEYGKEPNRKTFNYSKGSDSDERGKFIGTEVVQVQAPADEAIYLDRIITLYNQYIDAEADDYTEKSWKNASMETALAGAKEAIEKGNAAKEQNYSQSEISDIQTQINVACSKLEAAIEKLIYTGEAKWLSDKYKDYKEENYEAKDWAAFASARERLNNALEAANTGDPSTTKQVYEIQTELNEACEAVNNAAAKLKAVNEIKVTGVVLNKKALSMTAGNSVTLMAATKPSDATNQKVTWSSSDEAVATVDSNGKVTAQTPGTADITVRTVEGRFTAVCKVTVGGQIGTDDYEPVKYITLYADEDGENKYESIYLPGYPVNGYEYTGKAIKLDNKIVVLDSEGKRLRLKKDYTVSYKKNVNVGDKTAIITIKGKGKNKAAVGTHTIRFSIRQASLNGNYEIAAIKPMAYTGTERKASVKVKLRAGTRYAGKKSLSKKDFEIVEYQDNTEVGEATVLIQGKGNYKGSLKAVYTITPKSIKSVKMTKIPPQTYDGTKLCPEITLKVGNAELLESRDYRVEYYDNDEPGKASIEITGIGNYKDRMVKTFTIKE